jgi:hypothetical protein
VRLAAIIDAFFLLCVLFCLHTYTRDTRRARAAAQREEGDAADR